MMAHNIIAIETLQNLLNSSTANENFHPLIKIISGVWFNILISHTCIMSQYVPMTQTVINHTTLESAYDEGSFPDKFTW